MGKGESFGETTRKQAIRELVEKTAAARERPDLKAARTVHAAALRAHAFVLEEIYWSETDDFAVADIFSFRLRDALEVVRHVASDDAFNGRALEEAEHAISFRCEFMERIVEYGLSSARELLSLSQPRVPQQVELAILSAEHYQWLLDDPTRIKMLTDSQFEILVADRLSAMGMDVQVVGDTRRKDGGIDIVAWPNKHSGFPFLLAAQVKHHSTARKTGVGVVRDFYGAITSTGTCFNLGIVVTNTSFSADAKWFASHNQTLLRLRDLSDLCRWMKGDYVNEAEWREIPSIIELAPGVTIAIPKKEIWTP
jgi:hypothetical protein